MIVDIFFYVLRFFIGLATSTLAIIDFVIPSWMLTGMQDIMRGPIYLNGILPMYPNPNMTGIASQTGIIPIFGWLLTVLVMVVILKCVYMGLRILVRIVSQSSDRDITSS